MTVPAPVIPRKLWSLRERASEMTQITQALDNDAHPRVVQPSEGEHRTESVRAECGNDTPEESTLNNKKSHPRCVKETSLPHPPASKGWEMPECDGNGDHHTSKSLCRLNRDVGLVTTFVSGEKCDTHVPGSPREQEMSMADVQEGAHAESDACVPDSLNAMPSVEHSKIPETVKTGCETPEKDLTPSPSVCDVVETVVEKQHSVLEEQACPVSEGQSDDTVNRQNGSPDKQSRQSELEMGPSETAPVYQSSLPYGERCDAETPENRSVQEEIEDSVELACDTRREGGDNALLEATSPSLMQDTNSSETVEFDCETPSLTVSDEIEGGQACSGSGSQLDITTNKQSGSPEECPQQSEKEKESSKIEVSDHSSSEDDDVVHGVVSNTSTSNDDAQKDRETPTMVICHADIKAKNITHSCSTPDFKSSHLIAASVHFDKEGGRPLKRTVSGFAKTGPSKVIVPESYASEDVIQETEGDSTEEGSRGALSKTRVDIYVPETPGTVPVGGKMPSDSARELDKTNMSALVQDDFAPELRAVGPEHRDLSMDSSSASLRQVELPKSGLAHSTPALGSVDSVCSSSDLDRVENGENVKSSPRQIKRTYSSSVDTLVEEDIETLTTTSIQHTIISRSNSNFTDRTNSSLLIGSNESAVYQQQFVESLSDKFDIERDPLSASSLDAESAWREDNSFPRPHSRVRRMYSSSDSSPDSVPDFDDCIEISDSVTEALAHNQWEAYVSECRRCSSTLEGRELERLSKSGRLPHTGFTSSESMASLPLQDAETSPLLRRNSSRPMWKRAHAHGGTRRGVKSALAEKASRLLSFVLGKKGNVSEKDDPENHVKLKKRLLSSLLCGRS